MLQFLNDIGSNWPYPLPCEQFRRIPLSKAFFDHLPTCRACRLLLLYLDRDLELQLYFHRSRN
jgi:hypothetical protein